MALTEDATTLNIYLSDFGVSCQIGSGTAFKGILDATAENIVEDDGAFSTLLLSKV